MVVVTGLLLQVKQQDVALADWVQPPTQRGAELPPSLSFDQILAAASSVPQAEIADWSDVDRPDDGRRDRTRWRRF